LANDDGRQSERGPNSEEVQCVGCSKRYAVVDGTPVMLPARLASVTDEEEDVRRRTAESFAYEWTHFGELRAEWEKNFRDYIRPHDPHSLKGRVVLDVGAGSGRHSYEANRVGAHVVAVDVGDAIHVARRNLPPEVLTVQADADELPFADESFDLVMAIGVLHHLPDPQRTVRRLARLIRPGGHIHVYVYWVPSLGWHRSLLRLVSFTRRGTVRMPKPLLRMLCYPLAAVLFTAFVLPLRFSKRTGRFEGLASALPLKTYADYPFKVCVNDQFDRFSAPLEQRFHRDEVERMLVDAGFVDVRILENHGWIGSARRAR
jgi:SAM-dependent methyltransferase